MTRARTGALLGEAAAPLWSRAGTPTATEPGCVFGDRVELRTSVTEERVAGASEVDHSSGPGS